MINPSNGMVLIKKVFDTYMSSEQLDEVIRSGEIQEGAIVVAACQDDVTKELS